MSTETSLPTARISQIVLVSSSFSHRPDFLSLPPEQTISEGKVEIEVGSHVNPVENTALVTVRGHNNSTDQESELYRFDVTMAALLTLSGPFPDSDTAKRDLTGSGAAMLMPFLREVVASLTSRGRFGTLWLQPVNVRSLLESQGNVSESETPSKGSSKRRRG